MPLRSAAQGATGAFLAASLLSSCAIGPDRSPDLLEAWHACIVPAVSRMDDGKTDPVSVAYGVAPQCSGIYERLVEAQVGQMITDNAQIAQRRFVKDQELKLITSEILAQRSRNRKQP